MLPRKIKNTVHTCIILHDIILKDEGLRICLFHKNGEECVEVNEYTLNNFCCIETHNNLWSYLVQNISNTYIPKHWRRVFYLFSGIQLFDDVG